MTTCFIYDETLTQKGSSTEYHTRFTLWQQQFSRVPCAGEYIVRGGKWMEVQAVVWKGDFVNLTVYWTGAAD